MRVVNRVLAAANLPLVIPPGSDDAKLGVERHHRNFKTYLVVALARAAVSYSISALLLRDIHHVLRDQRTRKGSAEQIFTLINSPGAHRREDKVGQKFAAQIMDHQFAGATSLCLCL